MTEPATPKRRPIAAKRAAETARKSAYRSKLQASGLVTIRAAVDGHTAERLKAIAQQRGITLGVLIDECLRAADAAQRRAAWRARVAAEGRQVVTVSLNSRDAALLKKWAADQRKKEVAAQRAAKARASTGSQ